MDATMFGNIVTALLIGGALIGLAVLLAWDLSDE